MKKESFAKQFRNYTIIVVSVKLQGSAIALILKRHYQHLYKVQGNFYAILL